MYCDFCMESGVSTDKTIFVQGCPSPCLETLKTDEGSNIHVFTTYMHVNEVNQTDAPALKAKLSLNKSLYPKLQHLFWTAHVINIKGRPLRGYLWQNEMDIAKGLDIGEHYHSRKVCIEFTSATADMQRSEMWIYLGRCNFLSVIVDGSVDSSITHNEMVYIQSCQKQIIKTNFIQCYQVKRGVACGMVNAVERAVETVMTCPDFMSKLVALGSDGASVMLRKNSGIIALLKENNLTWLLSTVLAIGWSCHTKLLSRKSLLHIKLVHYLVDCITCITTIPSMGPTQRMLSSAWIWRYIFKLELVVQDG